MFAQLGQADRRIKEHAHKQECPPPPSHTGNPTPVEYILSVSTLGRKAHIQKPGRLVSLCTASARKA